MATYWLAFGKQGHTSQGYCAQDLASDKTEHSALGCHRPFLRAIQTGLVVKL